MRCPTTRWESWRSGCARRARSEPDLVDEHGFQHFSKGQAAKDPEPGWVVALRAWQAEFAEVLKSDVPTRPRPMKIAVTGANGMIGARVVHALLAAGHEPVAVVRRGADLRGLAGIDAPRAYANLRVQDSVATAIRGTDVLVHCAALFSYRREDEENLHQANVESTRAVMRAAADAGVRRVVLTSSSVVLGSSAGPQVIDESGSMGAEWVPAYFHAKQEQTDAASEEAARTGPSWSSRARRSSSVARAGASCRATPCSSAISWTRPGRRSTVGATSSLWTTWRADTSCSRSEGRRGSPISSAGRTSPGAPCTRWCPSSLASVGRTPPRT